MEMTLSETLAFPAEPFPLKALSSAALTLCSSTCEATEFVSLISIALTVVRHKNMPNMIKEMNIFL